MYSVHGLLVDAVVAVLLHHALGLFLKGLHGGVLPPQAQVSILVVFSPLRRGGGGAAQIVESVSHHGFKMGEISKAITNPGRQRRELVRAP